MTRFSLILFLYTFSGFTFKEDTEDSLMPAATITVGGTGSTRNMTGGDTGATLATFSLTASNASSTLNSIDFVFSTDITGTFVTGNFILTDGTNTYGGTYVAGTKTVTFSPAVGLPGSIVNYTVKGDVVSGVAASSTITADLANAGFNVTNGTVNPFTTITNTFNITALAATIAGAGTTRNMTAGDAGKTLATFSVTTNGQANSQTLNTVAFLFSNDITGTFVTGNFKLTDGTNTYTGTYVAGTKTVTFSPAFALPASAVNYTLKGDVATGAAASSTITVDLSNAGIAITNGTTNPFTTITNTFNISALAATVAGTGTTRNMTAGDTGSTLATFSVTTNGSAGSQTLNTVAFLFSTDITGTFVTGNFKLTDGTNTYSGTYVAVTKTVTFSPAFALPASAVNYTLKGDVVSGASASSTITVDLSNGGVAVTGGTVNSFTTITNTFNIAALAATAAGTGSTRNMGAGATGQTLATFSITSNGQASTQTLNTVAFLFSVDITGTFVTGNFKLTDGTNTYTGTYVAGTKTVTFSPAFALPASIVNYTLKGDVAAAAASSNTITTSLSNGGVAVTGGTVNSFTTITNTFNILYAQNSNIVLNGGTTNPINFAAYNLQSTSGLTVGNSTSLATFKIQDGGGAADSDSKSTTLDALTINIVNSSDLQTVAIFDNSNAWVAELPAAASVNFIGPLGLSAGDDASSNFTIRATFKANVTDNHFIQVTIASATANSGGSGFSSGNAGGAQTNGGVDNKISVVATTMSFTAGPIPAPPIPNTNFSFTVAAVDANGNIDANRTNNVVLSKDASSTGTGTLSSATGLTQPLSAGTYTWNDLRITLAGYYKLFANYNGGTLTGTSSTFQVKSLGASVALTPVAPVSICSGGGYQTLANVKITESDPGDFHQLIGGTFYLQLPAGFEFNTTLTAIGPTFTGGKNLSNMGKYSYIGNDIVKFSYDVGAVDQTDDFTITGLQARFTGTIASTANITVIDGSAIIDGDQQSDNQNHGTLDGTISTNTGYNFIVKAFPGQSAVSPNQTQFNNSVNGLILSEDAASPKVLTNQMFSGNGVSFSSIRNAYVFSPSSIGSGSPVVTFTGNDPITGCSITVTKTFSVSISGITGISNQYCSNDNITLSLDVPSTSYDVSQYYSLYSGSTDYPGAYYYVSDGSGNAYYSLLASGPSYGGAQPLTNTTYWHVYGYNIAANPISGDPYVLYAPPQYKYISSVTGNGTSAISIFSPAHGFKNGSSVYIYFGIYDVFTYNYLYYLNGTFTATVPDVDHITINYTDPYYGNLASGTYPGGTYNIYGAIQTGNPTVTGVAPVSLNTIKITLPNHGFYDRTSISAPNNISVKVRITLPGILDSNDSPASLDNWYTVNYIDKDNFQITTTGVFTGLYSGNGYVDIFNYRVYNGFAPSVFQTLNSNFGTVPYGYVGFLVNDKSCAKQLVPYNQTCAPFIYNYTYVTLLQPPAIDFTGLNSDFCKSDPPATLTSVGGLDGSFSGTAGTSDGGAGVPSGTFTPSAIAAGNLETTLVVTLTYIDNNQCSNTITKNTVVHALPQVDAGSNLTTCIGTPIKIGGAPTVVPTANQPFSISWDHVADLDNANATNPLATSLVTTLYTVTATDKYGCVNTDNMTVTASPPASANAGTPFPICAGNNITLVSASPTIGGSATQGFWSTVAEPSTGPDFTFNTGTFGSAIYKPTATDIANGSVTLFLTTNDPDAGGPCPVAVSSVNVTINSGVNVSVASSSIIACPGQASQPAITLTGSVSGGGSTSGTWSVLTGQGDYTNAVVGTNAPLTILNSQDPSLSVTYNPSLTETNSSTNINLSLQLSSDDPPGPCPAISVPVNVTLRPAPHVTVGPDVQYCADNAPFAINGSFSGGAASGAWTTNGTGLLSVTSSGSSPMNTVYTIPSSELNNSLINNLTFTLASDDPVGPCTADSKTVNITLNPIPASPIITSGYSTVPYCVNEVLSPLSVSGSNVKWYTDNAGALGTQILTITPTQLDLSSVLSNATDSKTIYYATQSLNGCESKGQTAANYSDPTKFTVIINPLPKLLFTATDLCSPDQTVFDASTSSINAGFDTTPSQIVSYTWDFADQSNQQTLLATTTQHAFQQQGQYDVTLSAVSNKTSFQSPNGCYNSIKSSALPTVSAHNYLSSFIAPGAPLRIGLYPKPALTAVKECFGDKTKFDGSDLSLNAIQTGNQWSWDFGDPPGSNVSSPTGATTTILHQYAAVGIYNVVLTITTSLNCSASNPATRVPILPYLNASNSFPYVADFESGSGGWVPDGFYQDTKNNLAVQPGYSWSLADPSALTTTSINTGSNGPNVWITNTLNSVTQFGTSYYPYERSVLYGPCVDVTMLKRPVFSMDYWDNTELGNDGLSVEVSKDDGASWEVLGSVGRGLNWYDRKNISGLTINSSISNYSGQTIGQALDQKGLTGNSYDSVAQSGWTTGKYQLDAYATETRLRVRFMFGSNGNDPDPYDGIAIDNVHIENRNRIIVAENFTNHVADSTNSFTNSDNFKNFLPGVTGSEVVKIEYHTTFGNRITDVDHYNQQNPADPAARAIFYGVTNRLVAQTPDPFKGFLDGYSKDLGTLLQDGQIDTDPTHWALAYYESRSLVTAPVAIDTTLSVNSSGKGFTVGAKISIIDSTFNRNGKGRYVIQVAIVEKLANGSYILRKMLPNAAGTPLTISKLGDVQTLSPLYWEVNNTSNINPNNLKVIVFVQDIQNKLEIAQSSLFLKVPGVSLVTAVENWERFIEVYPNPSDEEFNIRLPAPAPYEMKVTFSDQMGKVVHTGSISQGEQFKTLSTQGLSGGMYILHLGENGSVARKKVIIIHK